MKNNITKPVSSSVKDMYKVLVIGAGGIGGTTAACIAKAGYHVEIVDTFPGLADKISKKGIQVSGPDLCFTKRIKACQNIYEVNERKDIILIATKANVLGKVATSLHSILKDNGVVISLQNGICEEYLTECFGIQRVIGCIVGWGATVHEPGVIEKTSRGNFIVGSLDENLPNHFHAVIKLLSTVAPVQCSGNIYGSLYSYPHTC